MCNNNKGSNTLSFLIGSLVGVGAGMLLSTKKGRKFVKQAWKQVSPYVEDAVDTARNEFEDVKEEAKDKIYKTATQVKDFADDRLPSNLKKPVIKKTFFKGV